ncbi:hypothetical protein Hdeb2414_s0025g00663591 [Helianthus debilis subsp. tardiflorus]
MHKRKYSRMRRWWVPYNSCDHHKLNKTWPYKLTLTVIKEMKITMILDIRYIYASDQVAQVFTTAVMKGTQIVCIYFMFVHHLTCLQITVTFTFLHLLYTK